MSAPRACFLSQTLMDRETERRHNTASQKKCTSMNCTARLQPRIGSCGHIRPAPWQHARHSPGTPHACHRWRRLGFSRQLAHGRHHTSTSLDRDNPTVRKNCKPLSWASFKIAPKYHILKAFPSILVWRDPWFRQIACSFSNEFPPYHIHHPSDSL